jgi:peptidyl-dipeptidase Dcp
LQYEEILYIFKILKDENTGFEPLPAKSRARREDYILAIRTIFFKLALALLLAVLSMPVVAQDNPFLVAPTTPFQTPPFDRIQNAHFLPAVQEGIRRHQAEIDVVVNNPEAATFDNTIVAMDMAGQFLDKVTSVFYSLLGTVTSPEMQDLATQISPLLSAHRDNIWLSEKLFARVKTVYDQRTAMKLTGDQLYLLENKYRAFVRRGALLDDKQKARMREINREHSLLGLKFDDNLLTETNNSYIVINNKADLAGLPEGVIALGEETANAKNLPGKWVFTTQRPSCNPFMQYADARNHRQAIYKAYIMRGNRNNDFDNKRNVAGCLAIRRLPLSIWKTAWPRHPKLSTHSSGAFGNRRWNGLRQNWTKCRP